MNLLGINIERWNLAYFFEICCFHLCTYLVHVKAKPGWILGIRTKPPYNIHEIFTKIQYGKKTDVYQIRTLKITTRPRLQNGVAKNLL